MIGLLLMKSARTNEKSLVKSLITISLLRLLCIKYSTTIDTIGRVEAMVVAKILEIRSSLAWEYTIVFRTSSLSVSFLLAC